MSEQDKEKFLRGEEVRFTSPQEISIEGSNMLYIKSGPVTINGVTDPPGNNEVTKELNSSTKIVAYQFSVLRLKDPVIVSGSKDRG